MINLICGPNSDTVQAGLILHQSYFPEKHHTNQNCENQIKTFNLNKVLPGG